MVQKISKCCMKTNQINLQKHDTWDTLDYFQTWNAHGMPGKSFCKTLLSYMMTHKQST